MRENNKTSIFIFELPAISHLYNNNERKEYLYMFYDFFAFFITEFLSIRENNVQTAESPIHANSTEI